MSEKTSIIERVITILNDANITAGKYPTNAFQIKGKVIFAGGMGMSVEDKPRNVMGGDILRAEVFKVVLCGENYIALEKEQHKVKEKLRQEGYIQLSGLEHIEPKEGESLLQLAVTFKSTK